MKLLTDMRTALRGRRLGRRGAIGAAGGAAIALAGLSTAFACTVGLHGGLLIVPEDVPMEDGNINFTVFSTLNESFNSGIAPNEDQKYDLYIDPNHVDVPGGTAAAVLAQDPFNAPLFDRKECQQSPSDPDDLDIGDIYYGTEAVDHYLDHRQGTGELSPDVPEAPPSTIDEDAYLLGLGWGTISGFNDGTYEICTNYYEDPQNHWDHFRILSDGDNDGPGGNGGTPGS